MSATTGEWTVFSEQASRHSHGRTIEDAMNTRDIMGENALRFYAPCHQGSDGARGTATSSKASITRL